MGAVLACLGAPCMLGGGSTSMAVSVRCPHSSHVSLISFYYGTGSFVMLVSYYSGMYVIYLYTLYNMHDVPVSVCNIFRLIQYVIYGF